MIKKLLLISCISVNVAANKDEGCSTLPVHAPERLGNVASFHNRDGFHVIQNGNKSLRSLDTKLLAGFFAANNYLSINQLHDKEFALKAFSMFVAWVMVLLLPLLLIGLPR